MALHFDYYKPKDFESAYALMADFLKSQVKGTYYAGGTEVVSAIRKGILKVDAVIDLKGIEDMKILNVSGDWVHIGANVTLNEMIAFEPLEPMRDILDKIADHTIRNALTLGGNICGRLPYREAVLPLLAWDAHVLIYGANGIEEKPLKDYFNKRLPLSDAEMVYAFKVPLSKIRPLFSKRIQATTVVDYPLLHLVGGQTDQGLFVGLSGFGSFPVFQWFSQSEKSMALDQVFEAFESHVKSDDRSQAHYRSSLLKTALEDLLGGVTHG